MSFDNEGHVRLTPVDLQAMAQTDAIHLINFYLMRGTPRAFANYPDYCRFLADVASRIGVHPNNLFLRGSCHLGYSIAPNSRVWCAMDTKAEPSDLDLVIVDVDYFERLDRELREHDEKNKAYYVQRRTKQYLNRLQDRRFNLCRDDNMPEVTCVHHKDTMRNIAVEKYCRTKRDLSAFIFRDWMSARSRYQYDINELAVGINKGDLVTAPAQPLTSQGNLSNVAAFRSSAAAATAGDPESTRVE